ncbi:MAG TPA: nucleotidyltransferase family protein [Devosiaceae bacterium]|nr:nucleotidyltransferase family protein [Devosiaceae bacterium]
MSALGDIAVVLLAAGLSRRFGPEDKLEAILEGRPLALHAAETLAALAFGRKLAVCASPKGLVPSHLQALAFEIIINPAAERGQGSSLALGAAAAAASDGIMICLADMPYVRPGLLHRIVEAWDGDRARTVAAQGAGYLGPPVLFPRQAYPALLALEGDRGAKHLLVDAIAVTATPPELRDFDLPGDFS